jgi:hypothetical protein
VRRGDRRDVAARLEAPRRAARGRLRLRYAPVAARTRYDWQTFHLAYPELAIPSCSVACSRRRAFSRPSESAQPSGLVRRELGSRSSRHDARLLQEQAGDRRTTTSAATCSAVPRPFIRSGGLLDDNYGKFTATDTFTVAVLMRSTPLAWTTASALSGAATPRYRLGPLRSTRSAARRRCSRARARRCRSTSVPTWSPIARRTGCSSSATARTMKLFTKAGTASTALVGLGSDAIAFQDSASASTEARRTVFEGQIARVYIWDSALADADIQVDRRTRSARTRAGWSRRGRPTSRVGARHAEQRRRDARTLRHRRHPDRVQRCARRRRRRLRPRVDAQQHQRAGVQRRHEQQMGRRGGLGADAQRSRIRRVCRAAFGSRSRWRQATSGCSTCRRRSRPRAGAPRSSRGRSRAERTSTSSCWTRTSSSKGAATMALTSLVAAIRRERTDGMARRRPCTCGRR